MRHLPTALILMLACGMSLAPVAEAGKGNGGGGGGGGGAKAACSDGQDNDGDGSTDYPYDPGCDSSNDGSETNVCSDGVDNDGDGYTDAQDLHCWSGIHGFMRSESCAVGGSLFFPLVTECLPGNIQQGDWPYDPRDLPVPVCGLVPCP